VCNGFRDLDRKLKVVRRGTDHCREGIVGHVSVVLFIECGVVLCGVKEFGIIWQFLD
jgi:hypothetical protein